MNQSKRNGLLLISAILILIISAIWLACSEGPRMNADGSLSNVSWDSQYAYAPQIEGTVDVTNWHSALFMYEMRLVHNWSAALVEKNTPGSGVRVLMAAWYIYACVPTLNLVGILILLMKKRILYALFTIPMIFAIYCAFSIPMGLDYYFFVLLTLSMTCVYLLLRTQDRIKKATLLLIVILLSWHLVEFRKNSLVILPIYAALIIGNLRPQIKQLPKWGGAVLCSLLFYMLTSSAIGWVVPVEKTYPVEPMMESDLRIISMLKGTQKEEQEVRRRFEYFSTSDDKSWEQITAFWAGGKLGKDTQLFNHFKKYYIKTVLDNPLELLVAKAIQTLEFCNGGAMPSPFQRLVDLAYPAVLELPYRWKPLEEVYCPHWGTQIFRTSLIIGLAVAWIFLFYHIKKKEVRFPSFFYTLFLLATIGIVYLFGFVLVTPTADYRFKAPIFAIAFAVIWGCLISLCDRYMRKQHP